MEIQANEKSSLVVGLGRQSQALEEEDEKTREGRPSAQPLSVTSASRNPEMEARKRSEEDEVIEPKLNTKKTGETKSKFGVSNPFSSSGAKVGGEVRK